MSWLSNTVGSVAGGTVGGIVGGLPGKVAGTIVGGNLFRTQDGGGGSTDQTDASYLNPQQQMAQKVAAHAFQSFGIKASPEEISAFANVYHSENGGNALAVNSAVSNYLQTKQRFQELNANDPTQQVMADEKGFFNSTQARAAGYEKDASGVYQQMKDLAGKAPQLFGNLTPEQIDQYLAPVTRAAKENSANLETAASRRGLAGSSTELQSLADANRAYKENVLSAGLTIGQQQQQQQLGIMGQRQSQLFASGENANAMLPGILNSEAQLATNRQNQLTDQANYMNQLPLFLASSNPAPTMPAPTGSKNFFAPGQAGAALLPAVAQGAASAGTAALFA